MRIHRPFQEAKLKGLLALQALLFRLCLFLGRRRNITSMAVVEVLEYALKDHVRDIIFPCHQLYHNCFKGVVFHPLNHKKQVFPASNHIKSHPYDQQDKI